jgi:type II secretory pathway predicted ATPase ExeA
MSTKFDNPFRPGAGHMPPVLAGRADELGEFQKLLSQKTVMSNLVLTGLRGLGKTVLLETFKPLAIQEGWLWAGTDLSESTSITEENMATRILTDLSIVTSRVSLQHSADHKYLAVGKKTVETPLTFAALVQLYHSTPGLVADKLKSVLETVWPHLAGLNKRGLIFAYDEAQNLADHANKDQFPLSLLLDVFQSLQRKGLPYMLVLTGLPTLFPKLVEARTFAERMFRVVFLGPLTIEESREAIVEPIRAKSCPISFKPDTVDTIWTITQGYPYFIQYVCREAFDVWVQCSQAGLDMTPIPVEEILRKLDSDFFQGRWARATDRQRQLLLVIAELENSHDEFTVQDIVETAPTILTKPFGGSQVSQMLSALTEAGLVYRNRHGKYSFAVPLMGQFILRQKSKDALSLFE